MVDIKQIYFDLGNAVKGICDKVYPRNRPKAVDTKIGSYIAVSVPYTIRNNEMNYDGSYNYYTTTIQIEVYVRDKASSANPNGFSPSEMDKKVNAVLERFPISTDNIIITKPRVTLQTDDGDGFSVTIIQGSLRTK
ncbi:hypothetical protein [Leyella stercorea]|uniref:hypothetical protein n=1 Tax=Leyella stercorea TaxID=363265 RepID=UPI003AAC308C